MDTTAHHSHRSTLSNKSVSSFGVVSSATWDPVVSSPPPGIEPAPCPFLSVPPIIRRASAAPTASQNARVAERNALASVAAAGLASFNSGTRGLIETRILSPGRYPAGFEPPPTPAAAHDSAVFNAASNTRRTWGAAISDAFELESPSTPTSKPAPPPVRKSAKHSAVAARQPHTASWPCAASTASASRLAACVGVSICARSLFKLSACSACRRLDIVCPTIASSTNPLVT
mmetsp:Transcript_4542/g.15120  ORF Transcript_4542/g.15120 Transcript_4542/m.15120 type:complete len:231 (-) Transcript_4542:426-1118(-)